MTTRPQQSESPNEPNAKHMLSFDVEEYFQTEAAACCGVRREDWESFETRLAPCVHRILEILDEANASATFFVLGWVARHEADLVKAIAGAGHEIAAHGVTHAMLHRLSPDEFREELIESRKILEDISGSQVRGYRAPTFSITHATAWAIDVLSEVGYEYDSSVFPIRHDRYGVIDAPRFAHQAVGPEGGRILEIPPLTLSVLGMNLPVGGGGYFRLFPQALVRMGLKQASKAKRAGMIYLHPWELDPDQPELPMGKLSRWRHRVNLHRTDAKLRRLLERFQFTSVGESIEELNASATESFRYGQQAPS